MEKDSRVEVEVKTPQETLLVRVTQANNSEQLERSL